jgi:hypothetical protein
MSSSLSGPQVQLEAFDCTSAKLSCQAADGRSHQLNFKLTGAQATLHGCLASKDGGKLLISCHASQNKGVLNLHLLELKVKRGLLLKNSPLIDQLTAQQAERCVRRALMLGYSVCRGK